MNSRHVKPKEPKMNTTLRPNQLTLEQRGMLRLYGRAGTKIRCDDGAIWVTRDGDLNDTVLEAGQSHVLDHDAALMIYAFEPSKLRVCGETLDSAPHVPGVLASAWRALRSGVHA
jgi:Protein of unknown function (DUF2917)